MVRSRLAILFASLAVVWCCAGGLLAQGPAMTSGLLVLSKGELTLSVVNPATLQVIGKVASGPDPHEVVASDDGRTAYIANYNGGGNVISVVDLATMQAKPTIDLGSMRAPHGLWFVGGRLWFTTEASRAIGSYDPKTGKVDWTFETAQNGTHMIVVSQDLKQIVTTNISSATVSIIERPAASASPQGNWAQTVVPVGRGAEGFDVSPDGREAWVANAQDGTVSVIDLASKKVAQTLSADVGGANRLKFTPDGKHVLVTTLRGPNLTILDASARAVVKRLPIGTGAAGLEMQPDGARAYAACTPDDYVAVIDLKTFTVVGKINAGRQPDGLAWMVRR